MLEEPVNVELERVWSRRVVFKLFWDVKGLSQASAEPLGEKLLVPMPASLKVAQILSVLNVNILREISFGRSKKRSKEGKKNLSWSVFQGLFLVFTLDMRDLMKLMNTTAWPSDSQG